MASKWNRRGAARFPQSRRRDFDRAALFAFIPVLAIIPVWFLAMIIFWFPITLVFDIPWWYVVVGYLVAGLTLFIPSIQRRLLTMLMGARKPTPWEASRLRPAFVEVTQAWHIRNRKFVVGVVEDEDLNAYACGGHLVVVTDFAVRELTHQELCGVLAHELCHHLGSHTVALTINQWLTLPVAALARVGTFLNNVSVAATESFARNSKIGSTFGYLVATIFRVMSWVFVAGFSTTRYLGQVVGRSAEFHADQRVVRMGYGRQLAAALRRTVSSGTTSKSHPPARTRIARVEAALRPIEWRHPSAGT
jgi:Zn-dependent protease with chaperone function